jgi:hypothetical protein
MSDPSVTVARRIDNYLAEKLGLGNSADFFRQHIPFLLYMVVVGLVAYAHDFFEFSLHVDAELQAYRAGLTNHWIDEGRWGIYLVTLLFLPDPVVPAVPVLIAMIGFSFAALFLALSFSEERGLADYLFGAILVSCPVFYFVLYYRELGMCMGVAFAAIAFGLYQLVQWKKTGFILAALLFCFAIGVYQALILVVAVVLGLYLLMQIVSGKISSLSVIVRQGVVFIIVLALSYFLYEAAKLCSLLWMKKSFSNQYIESFVSFEPTIDYLKTYIPSSLGVLKDYYAGAKQYYYYENYFLRFIFLVSILMISARIFSSSLSWSVKTAAAVILVLILIAPGTILLMNKGYMPPRAMISVAFVISGLLFIAVVSVKSQTLKFVLTITVALAYFSFMATNQRYSLSGYLAWQADRDFSNMLFERIQQKAPELFDKPRVKHHEGRIPSRGIPIDFIGKRENYPESVLFIRRNVVGASFYDWGGGETRRIVSLFATMGNSDYVLASKPEKLSVIEQALKMPVWPHADSVAVVGEVVVVKFGDYHEGRLNWLCKDNRAPEVCRKIFEN